MKLSELSTLCMAATAALNYFSPDQGFLAEMPLWIQSLFMSLLLVVPGIGAWAGVMSWHREGHTGCLAMALIVMNILLVVVGAFSIYVFSSSG